MLVPDRDIVVEQFNGDQAVADAVAAQHLAIRFLQRSQGEYEFARDIRDSQADLQGMQGYYVEPGGNFWVARQASSRCIAGFVGLRNENAGEGRLKHMAVLPEYRGQQIGHQLARTLISWATSQDYNLIRLTTGNGERARSLVYEPLGFVTVGIDEANQDHLMELKLK